MDKTYILYNPLAGKKNDMGNKLEALKLRLADMQPICVDVTKIESYKSFFAQVQKEDAVYLCGGDGTINRLINGLDGQEPPCKIYYYSAGTGNDFQRDLEQENSEEPIRIDEYLRDLPSVTVNGESYRFLNNVGFGIDGYCTQVGDAQKESSDKPVNYTAIAIKGLLFQFRPRNATVTVDGTEYHYKNVWLAPTMKGRFYGGGMMPTPAQDRKDPEKKVSLMLIHGSGKLHTLLVFPTIFKGEHIKHTKIVALHSGHDICVRFDRPTPLQIDGETIRDVTAYQVTSHVPAKVEEKEPACV